MENVSDKCTCSDCGYEFPSNIDLSVKEKPPCPECQSNLKTIEVNFTDVVPKPHESVEMKSYNPTKRKEQGKKGKSAKKPIIEFFDGDDYSYKLEKFVDKKRIIDRENDLYSEVVKDKESGETIHENNEKLSVHFGHGSAKKI